MRRRVSENDDVSGEGNKNAIASERNYTPM